MFDVSQVYYEKEHSKIENTNEIRLLNDIVSNKKLFFQISTVLKVSFGNADNFLTNVGNRILKSPYSP